MAIRRIDTAGPRARDRTRRLLEPRLMTRRAAARAAGRFSPALVGLGIGLLALGPGLAPGFVLSYDMVFVPSPPFSALTFGLRGGPPRAVPSDAVVAALSRLMPADAVQKLILLLIFVLACSGAAALVAIRGRPEGTAGSPDMPRRPGTSAADMPLAARLTAGVCYGWNPFVAERLIIGQWALLLGYAGLPWVLRSLCRGGERIRLGRLAAALVPAAVGGVFALAVTALVAVPAAVSRGGRRERARRLATVAMLLGAFSLPWLIPALLIPVHTDSRGVDAFAARADTPFGAAGSLLMLGGSWNAQTVPRGYGGLASVVWLAVVLAALAGYALLARPQRRCRGLGVGALAGLVIAVAGAAAPGRAGLTDLVRAWPGFAVLRDGQQYLAPLALAEAVGLGVAVAWIMRAAKAAVAGNHPPGRGTTAANRVPAALGVMGMLAPVLLLPGLAWGAAGRLHSAHYPASWQQARRIIDDDQHPGAALVLPWAAYRRYRWNGEEALYEPWPRLLHRQVIWNDALQVGQQTVAAENPDAGRLAPVVSSSGPLTARLRAAGIRYVIVDAGPLLASRTPGPAVRAWLPAAAVLLADRDLVVYRLP
jgi:hypothetical protein